MSELKKEDFQETKGYETLGSGLVTHRDGIALPQVSPQVAQLGEQLATLGIVDKTSFDSVCRPLGPAVDDLAAIAALHEAGKLTKYQADRIRDGQITKLLFDRFIIIDKLGHERRGETHGNRI